MAGLFTNPKRVQQPATYESVTLEQVNPSVRAAMAVEAIEHSPVYKALSVQNKRQRAAVEFKSNASYIVRCQRLRRDAPEQYEQVKAGTQTLTEAHKAALAAGITVAEA